VSTKPVRAVAGVNLSLGARQVLGCSRIRLGQSVTCAADAPVPPKITKIGGSMMVDGHDVLALTPTELFAHRGRCIDDLSVEPGLASIRSSRPVTRLPRRSCATRARLTLTVRTRALTCSSACHRPSAGSTIIANEMSAACASGRFALASRVGQSPIG